MPSVCAIQHCGTGPCSEALATEKSQYVPLLRPLAFCAPHAATRLALNGENHLQGRLLLRGEEISINVAVVQLRPVMICRTDARIAEEPIG